MEAQIKKTVKSGNSSAVILPRAWLHKEVRVELVRKNDGEILCDVIKTLKVHLDLNKVIGIYLVGSYARGEENERSDVDVLVITSDISKELINEGVYSILIVSKELIEHKLKNDLLPLGPMIKEAKSLINKEYLDCLEVRITKKNIQWYIDTTKDKINLIERVIEEERKNKKKVIGDRLVYTIVLRIRTLMMIKGLKLGSAYSNHELINIIKNVSGETNAYDSYTCVKENGKEGYLTRIEEAEKLNHYLKKQLVEIRKLIKK